MESWVQLPLKERTCACFPIEVEASTWGHAQFQKS